MEEHEDFKHIVRIANTDLNGARPIGITLRQIKGINFMLTNLVCHLAKIDRKKRTGTKRDTIISKNLKSIFKIRAGRYHKIVNGR